MLIICEVDVTCERMEYKDREERQNNNNKRNKFFFCVKNKCNK